MSLARYMELRGRHEGPLFQAILKSGTMTNAPISPQSVALIVKRHSEAVGLPKTTAHDFRRTFAGKMLAGGTDIVLLQKLMGHASVATTASYDRRGEVEKMKSMWALDVPFESEGGSHFIG